MNTSDLKLKIFREIDSLEKSKLEDFYGVLVNFLNGQKELNDWQKLSNEHRQGILDAVDQIETGKVISHDTITDKYRKKYPNA